MAALVGTRAGKDNEVSESRPERFGSLPATSRLDLGIAGNEHPAGELYDRRADVGGRRRRGGASCSLA